MHECVMENVWKIKIKLENICVDLMRSIYAPYNEVDVFYPLALCTLVTRSQLYRKDCSPSPVSFYFLPLLLTYLCFNTPDPHHPHLLDPRSCDPSGLGYYSSVIPLV